MHARLESILHPLELVEVVQILQIWELNRPLSPRLPINANCNLGSGVLSVPGGGTVGFCTELAYAIVINFVTFLRLVEKRPQQDVRVLAKIYHVGNKRLLVSPLDDVA